MNTENLLAKIESLETLEELQSFLDSHSDQPAQRRKLLSLFRTVVEYETAADWSQAVRICESLAITGWGEWERVDAQSHFNGDCWDTWFINSKGEWRFRLGRWRRRKAGWILFNPEYHFSSDIPDTQSKSWKEYAGVEFPVVDLPALPSQRNYQKQMPFVMGVIGGFHPVSDHIFALKRELTDLLTKNMRPSEYGDALEHFYLTLYCPSGRSAKPTAGLKVGAYRAKQRALQCELHFDSAYDQLDLAQQKAVFRNAIDKATDSLESKFSKKRIPFDFAAFRADIHTAFEQWGDTVGIA